MRWLRQLFSRRRIYDDLAREIRLHLEEKTEALMADGMSCDEAEHQARRQFGNVTLLEERGREAWQWPLFESTWADFKFAWRQFAKFPGFSVTVIVTIALGVGANAAIFNLLRAAVFPSLSVFKQEQLFLLHSIHTPNDAAWLYSGPAFDRLRNATATTAPVAAHTAVSACNLADNSVNIELASMQLVSTNFFSVLGLAPVQGRLLLDHNVQTIGGTWPAVLRYGYWQQHYAADRSIVGRVVAINGVPVTIVGIAPKKFLGVIPGSAPDIWLPLEAQKDVQYTVPFDSLGYGSGVSLYAPYRNQDPLFWLTLIARVPAGKEAAATLAWTHAFQPDLALYARFTSQDRRASVLASQFTLHHLAQSEGTVSSQYARPLSVLMTMAAAVLLISCVNLANLQSTRLVTRQREFALRASLGASRARIVQQTLVENSILAFIGGALAISFALMAGPVLLRWASPGMETIPLDLHFGFEMYAFVFATLALVVFGFAFMPAWRMAGSDSAMSAGGRAALPIVRPERGRFSNLVLALQIALSLVLLMLTSMFGRTLVNLNHVDTGFDRKHILTVRFDFHRAGYGEQKLRILAPQLVERIDALPGVRSAALHLCSLPGCLWNSMIHVADHPEMSEGMMQAHQDNVGSGYFHTLGIPLLQGREFNHDDRQETPKVAIVNQSLARKLFGDGNPLGQHVGYGSPPADAQFQIIGVVGDARIDDLRSTAPPVFYRPLIQESVPNYEMEVRTNEDPLLLANAIRQTLLAMDPHLPITKIASLSAEYDRTLTTENLVVRLASIFGGLALSLAAIGLYGVLSFRVARSTGELGVRIALGATRANIFHLVMTKAAGIFFCGSAAGILVAFFAARKVHRLLFEINAFDWLSLIVAVFTLATATILAAFFPARRAASIDPMQALRRE